MVSGGYEITRSPALDRLAVGGGRARGAAPATGTPRVVQPPPPSSVRKSSPEGPAAVVASRSSQPWSRSTNDIERTYAAELIGSKDHVRPPSEVRNIAGRGPASPSTP